MTAAVVILYYYVPIYYSSNFEDDKLTLLLTDSSNMLAADNSISLTKHGNSKRANYYKVRTQPLTVSPGTHCAHLTPNERQAKVVHVDTAT